MSESPALRPDGLLAELLTATDRDHSPGVRPLVSFRDDDEPQFLDELAAHARTRFDVQRRGAWYGQYAELRSEELIPAPGPPRDAILAQRWHTARPIGLPAFVPDLSPFAAEIGARRRLQDELGQEAGLRAFLRKSLAGWGSGFRVHDRPPRPGDDVRDIEKVLLHWHGERDGQPHSMYDLWAKSAWLTDRDDDESLRLRISFGRELEDDASRDLAKHARLAELGRRLFPESELISEHPWLIPFLERQIGGALHFSQHIAYWNSQGGGALMHHDAFHEPLSGGQRGVLYLQLSGETLWIALSIEDLCRRVIEFAAYLEEGELSWVRQRLFPAEVDFQAFLRMCKRFVRVRNELARPGCGKLGALVNQGPEFSSLLADAGHAQILRAGDAILLPNQGLEQTCMHSVFGISEDTGYALSLAIRERRPQPLEPELPGPEAEAQPARPLAARRGWRARGSARGRRR